MVQRLKNLGLRLGGVSLLVTALLYGGLRVGSIASAQAETGSISARSEIPWSIHLYAASASPPNGTTLFVFTGKTENLCQDGKLDFIAEFEGTPTDFDVDYVGSQSIYSGQLPGFFQPTTQTQFGTLEARCTLPNGDVLVSNVIRFGRYYYNQAEITLPTDDSLADLTLNAGSESDDLFIVVMDANGLPKALPPEIKRVGRPYSFAASGSVFQSDNSMLLNLYFNSNALDEVNPLTLRIYEWKAATESWIVHDNQKLLAPIAGSQRVNQATHSFTTYVLVSRQKWYDDFTSSIGLDADTNDNIERISAVSLLRIANTTLQEGSLTSKPYTPTLPLKSWKRLSYTANVPPSTGLTVNVLSQAGAVLIDKASPGQSLADLDPTLYPSLKLRVEMTTTTATSPELFDWSLLAEPERYEIYLPLVIKA